jgi:hypothetical protein
MTLLPAVLLLVGCGKSVPPAYPVWFEAIANDEPKEKSANAYDGYALAARQAEAAAPEDLNRVSFTAGQRHKLLVSLAGPLKTLTGAAAKPCTLPPRAFRPDQAPTYQRGWRMLGRALAWIVERDLLDQKPEEAISTALVGIKFGFDLTGGSASDAALGYTVVDEVRGALAPALSTMSPVDLTRVINGVSTILRARPGLDKTMANEKQAMLAAVQFIQDSYRKDDFQFLKSELGPDAREPVRYLEELHDRDGEPRAKFFREFASEINDEINMLSQRATQPAAARAPIPLPPAEGRPWKRLSRHFFRSARPLLDLDDRTVARTRMLILNALILRTIREAGSAPKSLSSFPKDLTTDPYSGRPFRYTAVGLEFKLYSIGSDLRDDGGESDELGLAPDLVLEGSQD